jgi:hypothetical protein
LAQKLGGKVLTAGICGYGLTQMLSVGRRLIPKLRSELVVAQYSLWLSERASQPLGPSYLAANPVPFLFVDEKGAIHIHPPFFSSSAFAFRISGVEFRKTGGGPADLIKFLLKVSTPVFLHDDWRVFLLRCKQKRSGILSPTQEAAVETGYSELKELTEKYGVRFLVAVIGNDAKPVLIPKPLRDFGGDVSNGHSEILGQLTSYNSQSFMQSLPT